MKQGDMEVIVKGLAPVMIELVRRAVQPLADRIVYLEARQAPPGEPGPPGKDGFGFDDMDVCVLDDDRTIELSFRKGDEEKAFTLKWPTVIYRGVFKAGEAYEAGDAVTWGGSMWIAERQTAAKPDMPDEGWRLAVKRGQRGPAANV